MYIEGSIYSLPLLKPKHPSCTSLLMGDFDKKLEFFRESDDVMTLLGGCSPRREETRRGRSTVSIVETTWAHDIGEYLFFYLRIDG